MERPPSRQSLSSSDSWSIIQKSGDEERPYETDMSDEVWQESEGETERDETEEESERESEDGEAEVLDEGEADECLYLIAPHRASDALDIIDSSLDASCSKHGPFISVFILLFMGTAIGINHLTRIHSTQKCSEMHGDCQMRNLPLQLAALQKTRPRSSFPVCEYFPNTTTNTPTYVESFIAKNTLKRSTMTISRRGKNFCLAAPSSYKELQPCLQKRIGPCQSALSLQFSKQAPKQCNRNERVRYTSTPSYVPCYPKSSPKPCTAKPKVTPKKSVQKRNWYFERATHRQKTRHY